MKDLYQRLRPEPKPFFTWLRAALTAGAAALLYAIGLGVQYAEDSQLGSSEICSTWCFVMAGVVAVLAAVIALVKLLLPKQDKACE